MIRATITIALACLTTACHTASPNAARLKDCLPQNPADSTLFLRPNPTTTLTNGKKTRFAELIRTIENNPYNVIVWASWCPPDTIPQDGTPLIMLSIDQCADAWRIAIDQLPTNNAIHAQIDPYTAHHLLKSLGIYGIPHIVRIEP